ncbi:hypothetical protein LguiB_023576 [Lonicera macranthoides]
MLEPCNRRGVGYTPYIPKNCINHKEALEIEFRVRFSFFLSNYFILPAFFLIAAY